MKTTDVPIPPPMSLVAGSRLTKTEVAQARAFVAKATEEEALAGLSVELQLAFSGLLRMYRRMLLRRLDQFTWDETTRGGGQR